VEEKQNAIVETDAERHFRR